MAYLRWRLFGNNYEISTSYDLVIPFYGPQRKQFWTSYHPPSFTVLPLMLLKLVRDVESSSPLHTFPELQPRPAPTPLLTRRHNQYEKPVSIFE